MLKIFKYLKKKELIMVAASILFIVGQVWLDLKLPDYMSEITKLVTTEGSHISDVLTEGAKMLFCALGSVAMVRNRRFFCCKNSGGIFQKTAFYAV